MTTESVRRTVRKTASHLKTFDGAEHADGRRDHAVAVQQRGAEDAKADEDGIWTA
jgi:hypothetical protein